MKIAIDAIAGSENDLSSPQDVRGGPAFRGRRPSGKSPRRRPPAPRISSMKWRVLILAGMTILFGFSGPSQAAFQLSFGNAAVTPGGTTPLDVTVFDPAGVGIGLQAYNFDF